MLNRSLRNPSSLLQPDYLGDANATGHVAPYFGGLPISLAAGATFNEYFGVGVTGYVYPGTQINGTITITLTYEYTLPGAPSARFTYTPTDPLVNEPVTFDASSSTPNGGNLTSYLWDFGDGTTGTGVIVNHTYTTVDSYLVTLNVTDSEGVWATDDASVVVGGAPVAAFTYDPTEPTAEDEVTFDASASTPNGGVLTDPSSYVWDFGDGETGTGRLVNHTYPTAGDYVVTLNVTDSQSQSAITTQTVTVGAKADEGIPLLYLGVGAAVVLVIIIGGAVYALKRK
jgi:PKD repeat protein